MKLINKTVYETKDIKQLVKLVMKNDGIHKSQVKELIFSHSKVPRWCDTKYFHRVIQGTAYCTWKKISIRIPNHLNIASTGSDSKNRFVSEPIEQFTPEQMVTIAQVLSHELTHIRGEHNHKDMQSWWTLPIGYLGGLLIKRKPFKVITLNDKHNAKLIHARTMLKKALTKQKRATTILKKWNKKVQRLSLQLPQYK